MKTLSLLISMKYLVYCALMALGLLFLFRRRTGRWARAAAQLLSFVLLGGVIGLLIPSLKNPLGMHPSPMCSLTKLPGFVMQEGFWPPPLVAMLVLILVFSLVGKKLFCGWGCPLGALQELCYLIPGLKKVANLPFRFTNTVRAYLLAGYVVGLVAAGIVLYNDINAFEMLHWEIVFNVGVLGLGLLVLVSALYYRPYCYLVCPIGLVSWVLERFAPLRLSVDRGRCTSCQVCVEKSPCPAIGPLVNGDKGWLPDCTSCGLCLQTCPEDALSFGLRKQK
jgi:polyferredoxin